MRPFERVAILASIGLLMGHAMALADVPGVDESSLEWLVDSSDAIALVEVSTTGQRSTQVIKPHKLLSAQTNLKEDAPSSGVLFFREKAGHLEVFYFVDFSTKYTLKDDPPWKKYLAVDKVGHVISTREELIRRIRERIKAGSSVPVDCDRDAVEEGKSIRGGFRIHGGYHEMDDGSRSDTIYFELLVPADPEYRKAAEEALTSPEKMRSSPFFSNRDSVREILRVNYGQLKPAKTSEGGRRAEPPESRKVHPSRPN
ncbi:MAG: hypothetical protein ABFC96_03475 [Thermoguttaceae bacterium]